MRDGRVTLKASDATVAQILEEWAKIGQTRIVNGEMVTAELASIELTDVPELQALEVILRSVAAYVVVSRPTQMVNRSQFDRIVILPTSTPQHAAASTALPLPHYMQYPSLPPDTDTDSLELATPNPTGTTDTIYPAYPQSLPANASPPPPSRMPVDASVPAMPVQTAPQNPPAYRTYPIRNPQD